MLLLADHGGFSSCVVRRPDLEEFRADEAWRCGYVEVLEGTGPRIQVREGWLLEERTSNLGVSMQALSFTD